MMKVYTAAVRDGKLVLPDELTAGLDEGAEVDLCVPVWADGRPVQTGPADAEGAYLKGRLGVLDPEAAERMAREAGAGGPRVLTPAEAEAVRRSGASAGAA